LIVDHNDGVGTKDCFAGPQTRDCQCLFARQALGTTFRVLFGERIFRDICGVDLKWNPGAAEKFLTARRGGGENEHGRLILEQTGHLKFSCVFRA
jgi:hypothetical protein